MTTLSCGLPRTMQAENITRRNAVVVLADSGWKADAIASAMGVSERQVYRWLRDLRFDRCTQDRKSTERE